MSCGAGKGGPEKVANINNVSTFCRLTHRTHSVMCRPLRCIVALPTLITTTPAVHDVFPVG